MEDLLVVKNLKKHFSLGKGTIDNLFKYVVAKSLPVLRLPKSAKLRETLLLDKYQKTFEQLLAKEARSVKAVNDVSFYIQQGEV